jgi:membrane protease YdiL (CAAX protease family)
VIVAPILFAALHLPNPFLTGATLIAALAWCAIYDRHPNLIPLTLSHALLTMVVLSALDDATTGRLRVGAAYLASR